MPRETAIALGANLGDRLVMLRRARAMLARLPATRIVATAPVYESAPVDSPPEYRDFLFLNSVVCVETNMTPMAMLKSTLSIEETLGRDRAREKRNGARTIDLDLIYAGNAMINRAGLTLPHPRWKQRAFVTRPLADLRPNLILPDSGQTVHEILKGLDARDLRLFAACPWW